MSPNVCACPPGFVGKSCEKEDLSSNSNPLVDAGSLASSQHEAVCTAWGKSHFVTFDGKGFYYPGDCSYKLAYTCDGTFSVTVSVAVLFKLRLSF